MSDNTAAEPAIATAPLPAAVAANSKMSALAIASTSTSCLAFQKYLFHRERQLTGRYDRFL